MVWREATTHATAACILPTDRRTCSRDASCEPGFSDTESGKARQLWRDANGMTRATPYRPRTLCTAQYLASSSAAAHAILPEPKSTKLTGRRIRARQTCLFVLWHAEWMQMILLLLLLLLLHEGKRKSTMHVRHPSPNAPIQSTLAPRPHQTNRNPVLGILLYSTSAHPPPLPCTHISPNRSRAHPQSILA